MAKRITRIVLTGGPAAGKTTLISRILKEFKQDDGWKVITIPETATELISGFGIRPFGNCVSMLDFQYFVIADQLHKEKLALKGAQMVPEENVLIIYDRDEILLHRAVDQILHLCACIHGLIIITSCNLCHQNIFRLFQVKISMILDPPEKIALCDASHIFSLPVQYRNRRIFMILHCF